MYRNKVHDHSRGLVSPLFAIVFNVVRPKCTTLIQIQGVSLTERPQQTGTEGELNNVASYCFTGKFYSWNTLNYNAVLLCIRALTV